MATHVIKLDPAANLAGEDSPLGQAVKALRAGKLVAFPTETVYGVGVVATRASAVSALRQLKGRPQAPFTVHIADAAGAGRYLKHIPLLARSLMRKAWPGPLTLLLTTGGEFSHPSLRGKGLHERIAPKGAIGLRCPSNPVARALLAQAGMPVLATSANLAGRAAPESADQVLTQLDGHIDLLLDAGLTRYRKCSTIVAFDGEGYRVVRAGVYDAASIARLARLTILLVCTGNTCRSPMAAALTRRMLCEQLGCRPENLAKLGVAVTSAGTFALAGGPASPDAVDAAAALGAAVGKHRSRKLTNRLINEADLIFCMMASHVGEVVRRVSTAAGKTFLLDAGGDIADPIGGGADMYLRVARRIAASLRNRLKENWL